MTRLIFLVLFALRVAAFGAEEMKLPPLVKDLKSVTVPIDLKEAEVLSRVACSLCHTYPEPDLLPKTVWNEHVLPKMKLYLGIDQLDVKKTPEGAAFKASGLFPDAPRIPRENWPKIAGFYLSQAPDHLPVVSKAQIAVGLKNFNMDRPRTRRSPPLTSAVTIQADEQVIFMGDATRQGVDVLTKDGERLAEINAGNIPTSIKKVGEYLYIGAIGHFFPVEDPRGQLISLHISENGLNRKVLATPLPRVSHIEPADLNGDGKTDLAVSMFGYLTGRFSWFEGLAPDDFKEHVITNRSGAVQSAAYDFDKDGDKDLAVLFGQELESLLIFQNDGKGKFSSPKEVFRQPASYGHAAFDLADFNKDGLMDFIVANGDNGDYESPPKPYHGLRIYIAQKDGKYTEKYFYPMHGAFGVKARDFDKDGDLDIAAVSFFPDYTNNPRDSFVYLDQTGPLEFTASTFRECISGRWVALDAGDIDGDGDDDIALASLIRMPTIVPKELTEMWEKSGPSVLVLRNQINKEEVEDGDILFK